MMKILSLLILTFFGVGLHANPSTFQDKENGLLMEIPSGLAHTWKISNIETGLEVNVFYSDLTQGKGSVIAIAKLPLGTSVEEGMKQCYPLLAESLQEMETSLEHLPITIETLAAIKKADHIGNRFRLSLAMEGTDPICVDSCTFTLDQSVYSIATLVLPFEEKALEDFSQQVLDKIELQ